MSHKRHTRDELVPRVEASSDINPQWVIWPPILAYVIGILTVIAAVQSADAQEPSDDVARWKQLQPDSKAAWAELEKSGLQKLRAAEDKVIAARGLLEDFADFAELYAGSREAAVALINHGALAGSIGDHEVAEKSLRRALEITDDPQLTAAIRSRLAQLAIRPGGTPPGFAATSLAGEKITLAGLKGKVVLLDFWATWCGPCRAELPNVKSVYDKYHDQGFEIVGISLDRGEDALKDFVAREKMKWSHIYNGSFPAGKDIATLYNITSIPQMILIGRDGKIIATNLRGHALASAVKEAVSTR